MTRKFYRSLAIAGILASLFCSGFVCGRKSVPKPETGVRIDTVRLYAERIKVDTLNIVRIDTCWLETVRVDTVTVYQRDTVQVLVPIRKYVASNKEYRVEASGYHVKFDLIEVYPRTEYQIRYVKPKSRWGLGMQAGYGCTLSGKQVRVAPYIGVGAYYTLLAW